MKLMILEPITAQLAKDVITQIAANTDDTIDVLIMSPGGDVLPGNAIISALNGSPATVNTRVIGVAGSMAAVISQVGKTREIDADARFLLHFGAGGVSGRGTIEDHKASIEVLEGLNKMILAKLKGRMKRADLVNLLKEDRLMDAKEAVSLGFFDAITEPLKAVALLTNDTNMKTIDFTNAVSEIKARLGFIEPIDESQKEVIDAMIVDSETKAKEKAEARIEEAAGKEAAEILTAEMVTFEEFQAYKETYTPLMKSLLDLIEQMPTTEQMEAMIKETAEVELFNALKAIRSKTEAPRSASNGFVKPQEVVEDDQTAWNEKIEEINKNKI